MFEGEAYDFAVSVEVDDDAFRNLIGFYGGLARPEGERVCVLNVFDFRFHKR